MGGHYEKGLFDQLMDVQARLEAMETARKKDGKEIRTLTAEVASLRRENKRLRDELAAVKEENCALCKENEALRKENLLLREDNERMKRILSNDSSNTSLPPSTDPPRRSANTYNSREKTGRKPGGQVGHRGAHLSKAEVEQKIRDRVYEHRVEEIGRPGQAYVTRYRLDFEIHTIATEIRIYADEAGKYQIPEEMKAEVFYGESIRGIVGYLYSAGVVANDRICEFLNSLSGDSLHISSGSVYGMCRDLGEKSKEICPRIETEILNSPVVCTDATTVKTDGIQSYIRNFSTPRSVLYVSAAKKDLKSLQNMRILQQYTGILEHDHETALYHFGSGHGECNVHLCRYLKKNTEETGNTWSRKMSGFLQGMNCARKAAIQAGSKCFSAEQLARYAQRYDAIVSLGRTQNKHTRGKLATSISSTSRSAIICLKKTCEYARTGRKWLAASAPRTAGRCIAIL